MREWRNFSVEKSLIERTRTREIVFTKDINPYADGSIMVEYGRTKVHITATVENKVPPFLRDKGRGWVSAEYSMLPGSTHSRGMKGATKNFGKEHGDSKAHWKKFEVCRGL